MFDTFDISLDVVLEKILKSSPGTKFAENANFAELVGANFAKLYFLSTPFDLTGSAVWEPARRARLEIF